jgi:hypothetical protein
MLGTVSSRQKVGIVIELLHLKYSDRWYPGDCICFCTSFLKNLETGCCFERMSRELSNLEKVIF